MTEQQFDEFWNAYPRRTATSKAKAKYLSLPKKYHEAILESIRQHKRTRQWQNPMYIPFPTTWLNQERWKDEIAEPLNFDDYPDDEDLARKLKDLPQEHSLAKIKRPMAYAIMELL